MYSRRGYYIAMRFQILQSSVKCYQKLNHIKERHFTLSTVATLEAGINTKLQYQTLQYILNVKLHY